MWAARVGHGEALALRVTAERCDAVVGVAAVVDLGVIVMVGGECGGRTAELHDGVGEAHAFPEGWYADLGFEKVDVELKEYIADDFLF